MWNEVLDWLGVMLYGSPAARYQPGDGQALLLNANHELNLLCVGYSVMGLALAVGLVVWYRQRGRPK